MANVQTVSYSPKAQAQGQGHRWLTDLEAKVVRGEAAYHAARQLQLSGFTPDVIVAHPGWGESLHSPTLCIAPLSASLYA